MAKFFGKSHEKVLVETIEISEKLPIKTQIKRSESLLSLSIRDERRHQESSTAIPVPERRSSCSTRAEAGRAMRAVISRKVKTLSDEILRIQEEATLQEKQKMAVLVKEGGKTAIPTMHIDASLDGEAMTRSMIEWMDEHDLDRLLPL